MTAMNTKRTRPTQAERRAISREKVISAAIECLVTVGYAATSVTLIASTAGISTGRMQHQFSTKAEIMAAVIEFIHNENNEALSLSKLKSKDPTARVAEYMAALQSVFEKDYVAAAFEIRMAMKGDDELASTVGPKFDLYDTTSFGDLEELLIATDMGRASAHTWMRLLLATVRGLAMERVANYRISNAIDARKSLTLLANLITNNT